MAALAATGNFWLAAIASLGRIFGGLAFGCFLGGLLAALTYRFRWGEYILAPAIRVIRLQGGPDAGDVRPPLAGLTEADKAVAAQCARDIEIAIQTYC